MQGKQRLCMSIKSRTLTASSDALIAAEKETCSCALSGMSRTARLLTGSPQLVRSHVPRPCIPHLFHSQMPPSYLQPRLPQRASLQAAESELLLRSSQTALQLLLVMGHALHMMTRTQERQRMVLMPQRRSSW
jgi:hypothetical protein